MAKKPDDLNPSPKNDDDDFEAFADLFGKPDEEPEQPKQPVSPEDSAINLAPEAGPESGEGVSGISVVEWASLVDEPAQTDSTPSVEIDSPSDLEMLEHLPSELAESPKDSPVGPQTDLDPNATEFEITDLGGSEDLVRHSAMEPTEAGIDLSEPSNEQVAIESDDNEEVELSKPGGTTSNSESSIDLMADDIVMGQSDKTGDSSLDLIAEGLESGVDLKKSKKKATPSETVEDDIALGEDFMVSAGADDSSSAVNLAGSSDEETTFNVEDIDALTNDSEAKKLQAGGEDDEASSSGIDLADFVNDEAKTEPKSPLEKSAQMMSTREIELGDATEDEMNLGTVSPARLSRATDPFFDDDELVGKKKDKSAPDLAPDEKPSKKTDPARKGGRGGWIGGILIGGVLATTGLLGAYTAGIDPPDSLRELAGTKVAKPTTPGAGVPGPAPVVQPVGVVVSNNLRTGDLDAIKSEDLDRIDEAKPEELAMRAEARWLLYVREQRGKGLRPDAEPVKQAMTDLGKAVQAGNADALFLRAGIHKRTGNIPAARADYQEGVKKFAADPDQKERFEAALDALSLNAAHLRPAGVPLTMLLVFGYQPAPEPTPKQPSEPAPKFARAIKLASEGKFAEAIKLVDEAKSLHDERRSLFPNKPINPRTDPSEDTFLRACDQVRAYFTTMMKLANPDYLAVEPKDRVPQVDGLIKKAQEGAIAAILKDLGDKLAKDKPVTTADDLTKLIEAERKVDADKMKDLDGKLTTAKKDNDSLSLKLKELTAALEAKDKLLTAALDREKALIASNDASSAILKSIAESVNTPYVDLKTSAANVLKEVREVKRISLVVDPTNRIRSLEKERDDTKANLIKERDTVKAKLEGERDAIKAKLEGERDAIKAKLEGEISTLGVKLKNRWEPSVMLGHWLPLLDKMRERGDLATKALADADRVRKDPDATAAQKAQAEAVVGLVAGNREQYSDAKDVLSKVLPTLTAEWKSAAETALKRANDPLAELVEQAQNFADRNRTAEATALLDKGISLPMGNKGPLHVLRARIVLEQMRGGDNGSLKAAVQKDADAAMKEGLAEGYFLAGALAEETREWAKAEKLYREAILKQNTLDEAGARYRAALARLLLRRSAGDSAPRPVPPAERIGRIDIADLRLMVTLALIAPDLPKEAVPMTEAERIADEILAAGDKVSFAVRAQALAVKGLNTRAVRTYVEGLRLKGLLAPEYANGLLELLESHPALKRPDTRNQPNPLEGEKHYATGLNRLTEKKYLEAEREFAAAVENDGSDARYYYMLGLTQLAQGKREGYENLDRGADLERAGRPDRSAVSKALERIQGDQRYLLNTIRTRPARERGAQPSGKR